MLYARILLTSLTVTPLFVVVSLSCKLSIMSVCVCMCVHLSAS